LELRAVIIFLSFIAYEIRTTTVTQQKMTNSKQKMAAFTVSNSNNNCTECYNKNTKGN